jgi:hypothetical protein
MVVHCFRILFQERLSGGYPNPWWLIGHALNVQRGVDSIAGPVSYAHVSLAGFPVRSLATLLFALAAFVVVRAQLRETRGPAERAAAACEAGAALFLLYGFFAIGVHENHPHPLFLMLFATGLGTARLRFIAGLASVIYVFDMLSLAGLGRFHGPRYAFFEPVWRAVAAWRMELVGFDLTIALALLNVGLCCSVLHWLWSRAAPLAGRGPLTGAA